MYGCMVESNESARQRATSMVDEVSTATDTTRVETTSAQRRSRLNHIGARLLRYRRWRGEPQRNRKLPNSKTRCRLSRNRLRYSKQYNSIRPLKKPGRLHREKPQLRQAAKEAAERETKARPCTETENNLLYRS